jgi:hypothetical protein
MSNLVLVRAMFDRGFEHLAVSLTNESNGAITTGQAAVNV